MIFADFEKIHFSLFGFELMEPMALITDVIMGSLSVYFAFRLRKNLTDHPFYLYWSYFFLIFGAGAFYGGFAHAFYGYWGVIGKFPSWISGPVSVYCLEQAMISVHPDNKILSRLKVISFWKFFAVILAWILILSLGPIQEKPSIGFLPIAINTILGVSLSAGILGSIYKKKGLSVNFKYFVLGVLVMIPSAFVFLMKINLHQWFDKNDLSHVLLTAGITYFFIGCRKLYKEGLLQDSYL